MVAKGIVTAEDARLCLEHGVDAVYVSNHGGRSLDYVPSALEVLPEIADAIHGRVPILFDSGIRRGLRRDRWQRSERLRAHHTPAARAVMLGRPVL